MLALAWRNLWRQKGRSLATLLAVALVVAMVLILFGFMGGLMNAAYQDITRLGGHLQVRAMDYRDLRDFEALLLRDVETITADIAAVHADAVAVPVLEVPVLAAGETRSRGIQVTGVSYPAPLQAAFAEDYLVTGRLPEDLDGIVLGVTLAQALNVELGDEVFLYAPGVRGIGAAAYRLIGLVELSDPVREGRLAYLSLAAAQELAAPGNATRVEVHLPEIVRLIDDDAVQALQGTLQEHLAGLSVETWREVEPVQANLITVFGQLLILPAVIFFVLAGLMVVNTTYLSLMERIREFGTIISLGATPRKVMRMIVTESVVLCMTGALCGAALGLAAVAAMAQGVTLPEAMGALDTFGLPQTFYASLSATEALLTIGLTFLTGVLAALWPAGLAARLEPAEAMRYVP